MVFVVAEIIDDHDDTNNYIVNVVAMIVEHSTNYSSMSFYLSDAVVKLRRGSGKDRQGMAVKAKGLKASTRA